MNILLLEDDEALALGIEFTLKEEGYHVIRASTVAESIKRIDEESIQLALLDIGLPDGTGYDVCRYIRTKSELPVIFLTAYDDEVNVVMGFELGGDDYVSKPFRIKELTSRIRAVSRRSGIQQREGEMLKSGDLSLEPLDVVVIKNGKKIPLTAQEYKLLLIFMKSPEQVLSREVIFDKLLESEVTFMDDNTLAVYIKRLREKIEDSPSHPSYIVTVRGMGYKWNQPVVKGRR